MPPAFNRMPRWLITTLVLASSLTAALQGRAADMPKPADPGFVYLRSVFDCTPRQTIQVTPALAATIADSTFGSSSVDGYACSQWSETGPEAFYELTVTGEVELFAGLRDLGDRDLDLFLLKTCDSDSCLLAANIEFTAVLQPGTYTLVVDGYAKPTPQAGPFTLELSARETGLPAEICSGAGTTPVPCQVETSTFEGDLAGLPDLVRTNDCSLVLATGGEQWYAVTVASYHEFTATVSNVPVGLDPVLWLFPGCGPDIQCLDMADDKTAGQGEALTWSNASFIDTVVYLGVDAAVPPATGQGAYTLEIRCQAMVPNARSSFGTLKALYR